MEIPFVHIDFLLSCSGKHCWTVWTFCIWLNHGKRTFYLFFFIERLLCPTFLSHLWLPFGWIMPEAHCQLYGSCTDNLKFMNTTVEFTGQSCNFLGFASIFARRCFGVSKCYRVCGKFIYYGLHCDSPKDSLRTRTPTFLRYSVFSCFPEEFGTILGVRPKFLLGTDT